MRRRFSVQPPACSCLHREACFKEVDMMKTMQHPNIVAFKESFFSEGKRHLCIVMTYCDGGDLEQRLKRANRKLLKEDLIMHWFVQMALGLQYMHQRHVLHRDIKSQNIFMLGTGRLVLGDLGIAKALGSTTQLAQTTIGTPYYMSPELFKNLQYNHKSDIWALGCVLYEMATFSHPFEASSLHSLAGKIMKGKYTAIHHGYSRHLHQLISSMLALSPADRPDLDAILSSRYVKRHVFNFMKDVATRAAPAGGGSGVGDGTLLLHNIAAQVAGSLPGATQLGPHASAMYSQLSSLGLTDVVTEAFESATGPLPSAREGGTSQATPAVAPSARGTAAPGTVAAQRALREQRNALTREQERRNAVQAALAKLRDEKELRAAEQARIRERARARMAGVSGSAAPQRARPAYLKAASARRDAALAAKAESAAAAEERRAAVAARKAALDAERREAALGWERQRVGRSQPTGSAGRGVSLDAVRAASAAAKLPPRSGGDSDAPGGKQGEPASAAAHVDRRREASAEDARRLALLGLGVQGTAAGAGPGPRVRDPFQRAAARSAGVQGDGLSAKERVLAAKVAKAEAEEQVHLAELAAARAGQVAERAKAAGQLRSQYASHGVAGVAAALPVSAAGGALYQQVSMASDDSAGEEEEEEEGGAGEDEDEVAVQMEMAASLRAGQAAEEAGGKAAEAEDEEDAADAAEEAEDLAAQEASLQAELAASTVRCAALKATIQAMAAEVPMGGRAAVPVVMEGDADEDVLAEYEGDDDLGGGEDAGFYGVPAAVGVDVLFQGPAHSPSELPGQSAFSGHHSARSPSGSAPQASLYSHPLPGASGTARLQSQCSSLEAACRKELGADAFAAVYREVQALFMAEDLPPPGTPSPLQELTAMYGAEAVGRVQQLVQLEEAIAC